MNSEKGFSLIEVVMAMALMGIIAAAFLMAMATGSKAIFIADERATAESLARSQMEYVKNQEYDDVNDPLEYDLIPDEDIPAGYDIDITAVRLDPEEDPGDDDGIQLITITVSHNEKPIVTAGDYTLRGYKLDR